MTSTPGAAASLRAASPACLMPSLVSAMSSRPENLRSADSSVAPWRSSSAVVGLPAALFQPGAAPSPGDLVSWPVTGPSQGS